MNWVKKQLKNWLLPNRSFFKKSIKYTLIFYALTFSSFIKSQTANYISNGSFENLINCNLPDNINKVKYWRSIDSINFGNIQVANTCYSTTPYVYFGFQYPRTGNGFVILQGFCQPTLCVTNNSRGYLRNRLKSTLQAGKTYCVKFFVNISENSTRGIDALGIYFGDSSLDTITYINKPLNYLVPQVQNPLNNILSDTLMWIPVTGTFVANGNEKYCVIGNFKNDINVNTSTINHSAAHLSQFTPCTTCSYTNVYVDDVSCIPLDLPAYAGPDIWAIPGNTVYIGRVQDAGIDEACMWYKLPNITTAIDTAAGITVTVGIPTSTYIVKQDICGNVKYDTVIVYASGVGATELQISDNKLNIYPQPVNENLIVEIDNINDNELFHLTILNKLGQLILEDEIYFKNKIANIKTHELKNGVYLLNLKSYNLGSISKRFIISR